MTVRVDSGEHSLPFGLLVGKGPSGPFPVFTLNMKKIVPMFCSVQGKKVQVGKDQEKAQSEKDSHSKNRGGKKPN